MKFTESRSDHATLEELGNRIARYRLNGNWTQAALAREAGVSKRTLHRLEHGDSIQASNLIRILRALHLLENLEALVPEPTISPIQQVRLLGKLRQRASSPSGESKRKGPWSWGGNE
jgi:transcriptional regulator with XRE-family HTH domain